MGFMDFDEYNIYSIHGSPNFFLGHPPCLNHVLFLKPSLKLLVNTDKYATDTQASFKQAAADNETDLL
jgi:hypothetical protein